jgi:hypothetical protein
MNISNDNAVMIFKREYEGNTFYSVGLNKKNQDGTYTNGYMPCQFKKGAAVEDKTKIYIKKAWLSFYLKDKETKPYIFISEFTTLDNAMKQGKEAVAEEPKKDPYKDFAQEVVITEEDLPF